jgi:hypothetical protein
MKSRNFQRRTGETQSKENVPNVPNVEIQRSAQRSAQLTCINQRRYGDLPNVPNVFSNSNVRTRAHARGICVYYP